MEPCFDFNGGGLYQRDVITLYIPALIWRAQLQDGPSGRIVGLDLSHFLSQFSHYQPKHNQANIKTAKVSPT